MAIIQLNSTNPKFSYLIHKNPHGEMMLKKIKKGIGIGWFSDEQTYNMYFKDGGNDISFKSQRQEAFDYLNSSRYNSPLAYIHLMNDFMKKVLGEAQDDDEPGAEHAVTILQIEVKRAHFLAFFQLHFQGVELTFEEVCAQQYHVCLRSKRSLRDVLIIVQLLHLFIAVTNKALLHIDDDLIARYISYMVAVDAPYFIRYLFSSQLIQNKKSFLNYKELLEESKTHDYCFAFGNTHQQRRAYIQSLLSFERMIIDLGCGVGYYAVPFSQRTDAAYIAIDIDATCRQTLQRKVADKQLSNVSIYESLQQYLTTYEGALCDVLLTEVIEHMPLTEAQQLIAQIIDQVNFQTCVITTPNVCFNTYYELDERTRHVDHHWEADTDTFTKLIATCIAGHDITARFVGIGDIVDGLQPTQAVILERGCE